MGYHSAWPRGRGHRSAAAAPAAAARTDSSTAMRCLMKDTRTKTVGLILPIMRRGYFYSTEVAKCFNTTWYLEHTKSNPISTLLHGLVSILPDVFLTQHANIKNNGHAETG